MKIDGEYGGQREAQYGTVHDPPLPLHGTTARCPSTALNISLGLGSR